MAERWETDPTFDPDLVRRRAWNGYTWAGNSAVFDRDGLPPFLTWARQFATWVYAIPTEEAWLATDFGKHGLDPDNLVVAVLTGRVGFGWACDPEHGFLGIGGFWANLGNQAAYNLKDQTLTGFLNEQQMAQGGAPSGKQG